jgi:hypothetical protein
MHTDDSYVTSFITGMTFLTGEAGPITAGIYYERRLGNRQKRVLNGELAGLSERDCLDQQSFLKDVLGEDGESQAFAMSHGDLNASNIIVDEQYNIKGYFIHYEHHPPPP